MYLRHELQEEGGQGAIRSSHHQPKEEQRARVWEAEEGGHLLRSLEQCLRGADCGWDFLGSAKAPTGSLSPASL